MLLNIAFCLVSMALCLYAMILNEKVRRRDRKLEIYRDSMTAILLTQSKRIQDELKRLEQEREFNRMMGL